jgi:protein-S-isoprenylcysteine O-methyltransferase Ste14
MASARLALIAIASTTGFVGLAVLGWGGPAAFFAHPPLVALTMVTFGLTVVALFSTGNLSRGEREDRSNRWVLVAFTILGLLLAWLPAWTDRHDIGTFGGDALRWIGVTLSAMGGALRLWPVFVLGRRFSGLVAIQRDHQLVTTGPYHLIRHPSYLGLLVSTLGWALAFRSGPGVLLAVLTLIPVIGRIRAEERLLLDQFGDTYAGYRGRTWRLVPGLY